VLVVQVDVVGAEPGQRALDRGADVGAAVHHTGPAAGMGDEPELGRQHHLIAAVPDGLPDDFLAVERSVDLGGVDVGDTQLERPVDGSDRLGVVQTALVYVPVIVMAPRPIRETSSPPREMCFINVSLSFSA
jgi:hypothetical protein